MSDETKIVYRYNNDGTYAGIVTLDDTDKSPSGTFNIPANATTVAPSATKDGYAQVWSGTAWSYVADYRGKTYWLSTAKYGDTGTVMTALGDLPTGATLTEPTQTDAEKLAAAQDSKIAALKALLAKTDYEATKYAEGVVTATQYANMKAAREEWRAVIKTIEACTTVDAVTAVTYSTDIPAVD